MAHGSGFFGKGAGLELTVYAELVYVGEEKPARPPFAGERQSRMVTAHQIDLA